MKHFYELKDVAGVGKADENYVVIAEYPEIEYTLIFRNTIYEPWVAAWAYNREEGYWGQGHYFSTLEDALDWIQYKKGVIHRARMEEIASKAIDHIIETDIDDAEEWFDEIELDDNEKEYFCVEATIADTREMEELSW